VAVASAAPRSRQITMPAPHHSSFFTGRMPFLLPNQQRQSTEGTFLNKKNGYVYQIQKQQITICKTGNSSKCDYWHTRYVAIHRCSRRLSHKHTTSKLINLLNSESPQQLFYKLSTNSLGCHSLTSKIVTKNPVVSL